MFDIVGQGLCVGGGAGAATPNVIVKLGNFVRGAIGHVGAGRDARVYHHCLFRKRSIKAKGVCVGY